jgi:hypothetical protein
VRRSLLLAARFLVVPTLLLAAVVLWAPGRVELAIRIYGLLVAAGGLVLALAVLRRAYPRARPLRRRPAARRRGPRARPETLARLEQEVVLGVAGSFDLHHRLRPRLRPIATDLLTSRRGISPDRHPERAHALLGDAAWDLVQPGRPAPEDRQARGIPISELRAVVEALERV